MGLIPGSGRSPGEANGNLLQYSCLGNPMDRGAWWATIHRVTKSWTRLSMLMPTYTYLCHIWCFILSCTTGKDLFFCQILLTYPLPYLLQSICAHCYFHVQVFLPFFFSFAPKRLLSRSPKLWLLMTPWCPVYLFVSFLLVLFGTKEPSWSWRVMPRFSFKNSVVLVLTFGYFTRHLLRGVFYRIRRVWRNGL